LTLTLILTSPSAHREVITNSLAPCTGCLFPPSHCFCHQKNPTL